MTPARTPVRTPAGAYGRFDEGARLRYVVIVAKRYFTVQEVNELVPHLSEIMTRILQLHAHLRRVAEQLAEAGLQLTPTVLGGSLEDDDDPDLARMHAHARGLYAAVQDEIASLESLGAEIRDVESGLLDFHSLLDGTQDVFLTWRVGERKVTHYHEGDRGRAGKKPVEGLEFLSGPRADVQV